MVADPGERQLDCDVAQAQMPVLLEERAYLLAIADVRCLLLARSQHEPALCPPVEGVVAAAPAPCGHVSFCAPPGVLGFAFGGERPDIRFLLGLDVS
jgi:hypothetical protein